MSGNIGKVKSGQPVHIIRFHPVEQQIIRLFRTVHEHFIDKSSASICSSVRKSSDLAGDRSAHEFVGKIESFHVTRFFFQKPCLFFSSVLFTPLSETFLCLLIRDSKGYNDLRYILFMQIPFSDERMSAKGTVRNRFIFFKYNFRTAYRT